MFRPASLLTTPVAPPDTTCVVWQPWFLCPSLSWFVTSPRPGYTTRPNRAIDGMRTFTSSDAQPCRLLPERQASAAPASGSAADAVRRRLQPATHSSPVGQVVRWEAGLQVGLLSRDDH